MKTTLLKVVFAVGALFALANCSKSSDSASAYGNCQAGQVYTQQGCLSSMQCGGTGGWNGNQCLPMINQGINQGVNGQVCTQIGPLPVGACSGLPQFTPQYPNYGFYQGNCYPAINQGYNTGYNQGYNTGYNQCPVNSMNTGGWM